MKRGTALYATVLVGFLGVMVHAMTVNVQKLQHTISQKATYEGAVDPNQIVQATAKAMKKADQHDPYAVYEAKFVEGTVKIYWISTAGDRVELASEKIN